MTEEVIGQLAQVQGLKVISRTSSEASRAPVSPCGRSPTRSACGMSSRAPYVMRAVDIRVAVDLIDATTDAHVWASSYDRDLTDVFEVQEEIARHVADSLVSTVGMRPTIGRVARTEQPAAYAAYLAGRYLLYRRTRDALRGAMEQFQHAIALDSTYAPAYAGLASVYMLWVFYAYPGIDFYESEARAIAMADRAIALDSTLGEAYAARGQALARAWAPAEQIESDFQRALELRPNSPDVHQWYAPFLSREARYEAAREAEQAVALDPLAPGVRVAVSNFALAPALRCGGPGGGAGAALEPSLMLPTRSRSWPTFSLVTPSAATPETRSLPRRAGYVPLLFGAGPGGGAARRFARRRV